MRSPPSTLRLLRARIARARIGFYFWRPKPEHWIAHRFAHASEAAFERKDFVRAIQLARLEMLVFKTSFRGARIRILSLLALRKFDMARVELAAHHRRHPHDEAIKLVEPVILIEEQRLDLARDTLRSIVRVRLFSVEREVLKCAAAYIDERLVSAGETRERPTPHFVDQVLAALSPAADRGDP